MEKAAVAEKIQSKRTKKGFYSIYDSLIDEGSMKQARLMVLRGKWRGASVDFLADQSALPLTKVKNMLKGYDAVYQLWSNNKPVVGIAHLSEEEVSYLMNLFGEK